MRLSGDEFDRFFEAEFPRLFRLAYVMTGNSAEAEDLAQEAMVRTYRAWNRIKDRERPGAYARTVLINLHRSLLRRVRLARRRPDPAERMGAANDESIALWHGVLQLPPRQREAIVLRYYEDLTEAETASILGIPVGTVKSHVKRGVAKLRAEFVDAEDPPRTRIAE